MKMRYFVLDRGVVVLRHPSWIRFRRAKECVPDHVFFLASRERMAENGIRKNRNHVPAHPYPLHFHCLKECYLHSLSGWLGPRHFNLQCFACRFAGPLCSCMYGLYNQEMERQQVSPFDTFSIRSCACWRSIADPFFWGRSVCDAVRCLADTSAKYHEIQSVSYIKNMTKWQRKEINQLR